MAQLKGGTTIGGYLAIHFGNLKSSIQAIDGSGSGIDADMLDGYNTDTGTTANTIPVRNASGAIPGDITGNSATATKLQTARTINGVSFDGTANININLNNSLSMSTTNDIASVSGASFNGSSATTWTVFKPDQNVNTTSTPQFARVGIGTAADSTYKLKISDGTITTGVSDGASAIGFTFNTPSYTTAGAKIVSFKNNGTEKAYINKDGSITAYTYVSTVATGTAPFTVSSTTAVTNLNADMVDGKHASDFALSAHTHGNNTLTIGNSVNIVPYRLASFESYANNDILNFSKQANVTSVTASNEQYLDGKMSMKIVTDASCNDSYVYMGTSSTDYNIPVKPNTKYCYSFYAKTTTTGSTAIQGYVRTNDASNTHHNPISSTLSDTDGWKRFYGTFTTPAGTTACIMRVDVDSASKTVYFDCFQLEELTSSQTEPSVWRCPSATEINGVNITSGTLTVKDGTSGTVIIKALDTSNEECVVLDQNGIKVTKGKISVTDENDNLIITSSGIHNYVKSEDYINQIDEINQYIDEIYVRLNNVDENIYNVNNTISLIYTNLTQQINNTDNSLTQLKNSFDDLNYYVSNNIDNVYLGKSDFTTKLTLNRTKLTVTDSGVSMLEITNKRVNVDNLNSTNYVTIGSFKIEKYTNGSDSYLLFRGL